MVKPNLSKIKEDFDTVIRFSQNIPDPKTDRLFDVWMECKRDIIEVFGGKYIYEYPEKVAFELGEKEKHERVIRFAALVESQWGYSELAQFIEAQEPGFFQNMTVSDYTAWDGKLIKKGTKLVKAFKHFIKNNRSLADVQNEASRIIQEDKVEGTLCISVHPFDFLSLSENTYNWRSCHALDGEYRAGNLSYMMDKSTVVCYLKTANNVELPGFPPEVKWNSKKWRVLIYLSDNWKMIFAGRQYPFETSVGMDFLLKEALPQSGLLKLNQLRERWTDWNKTLIEDIELTNGIRAHFNSPYIPMGNELKALEDVVIQGEGSKQYNDVLYSSCYKPIYAFKYALPFWVDEYGGYSMVNEDTQFHIGGYTYCLWCGEEESLMGADTMLCEKCELEHGTSDNELFTYCDSCGRRIYADDAYIVDDDDLCEDCFNKYCTRCECCGEVIWNDYIHYHEKTNQYVCEDCLYDLNEQE